MDFLDDNNESNSSIAKQSLEFTESFEYSSLSQDSILNAQQNKIDEIVDEKKLSELLNHINYGTILAYLDKFGKHLTIKELNYQQLEVDLVNSETKRPKLRDFLWLLVRNLNIGKTAKKDKWESCLAKFVAKYSTEDALVIEQTGYFSLKIESKLTIIKNLLECQFDENHRFKQILAEQITDLNSLRSKPIGKDIHGLLYWFYVDTECSFRLFTSTDTEGTKWKLSLKEIKELKSLVEKLSADQLFLQLKNKKILESEPKIHQIDEIKKHENLQEEEEIVVLSHKNQKSEPSQTPRKSTRQRKIKEFFFKQPISKQSSKSNTQEIVIDSDDDDEMCLSDIKKKIDSTLKKTNIPEKVHDCGSIVNNDPDDESLCKKCLKIQTDHLLIICDSCDAHYHIKCLTPILEEIPEGDWLCEICEHETLVKNLLEKVEEIETNLIELELNKKLVAAKFAQTFAESAKNKKDAEDAEIEKEKLMANEFKKSILALDTNVNSKTGRSCRSRTKINYTFEDYDRKIKEATGLNEDEDSRMDNDNEETKSVKSFKETDQNEDDDESFNGANNSDTESDSSDFKIDINENYLSYDEFEYESNDQEDGDVKKLGRKIQKENYSESSENEIGKNLKLVKKPKKRIIYESEEESSIDKLEEKNANKRPPLGLNNRFKNIGLFRKRFKRINYIEESDNDYTAYNEDDYETKGLDFSKLQQKHRNKC